MANEIKLPHYAWFETKEKSFKLNDGWNVTVQNFAGYNKPAIKPADIKKAVTNPIGMAPLRDMARGRKEVVIIFDDLTRFTKPSQIVPFILDELKLAGIQDENIRFIAAIANHHALTRIDMVKKLGEDVVSRFPVYNHCPFLNCKDIGVTSYGTHAQINAEVMFCDLKIAIGQVVPHPIVGLSGGGKIIMPGVSSYGSVMEHHGKSHQAWKENRRAHGLPPSDVIDGNPLRSDALEIAKLAGVDMVINTMVNSMGEETHIFTGALEPAYAAAVKAAKAHYVANNTMDNDIVFTNNFVKASEFMVPLAAASRAVKKEGGSVVVIDDSPSGQVVHYLYDNFGKSIKGDLFFPIVIAPNVKKVIIYNEFPEARLNGRFAKPEEIMMTDDWDEVISTLEKIHGNKAKVTVYPNGDTQYFEE